MERETVLDKQQAAHHILPPSEHYSMCGFPKEFNPTRSYMAEGIVVAKASY